MASSKKPQSLSEVRASYGPVTELEHVPVALMESVELATELATVAGDDRLPKMLQSIVDLLFARPDDFVRLASERGANESGAN